MHTLFPKLEKEQSQKGINMVDLMMWLVIAALLLAAAIQGIGYYQKAAFVHQMKSDLTGAASLVVAASSMDRGVIDRAAVDSAVAEAKWTRDVTHTVEEPEGKLPYIRASHPGVEDRDAIYIFEECLPYGVGLHIVHKEGDSFLENCGIVPPPVDESGDASTGEEPSSAPSADDIDGDGIPNSEDPDMDGDDIPNDSDWDANGDGVDDDAVSVPAGYTPGGPITTVDGTPYPYLGSFTSSILTSGATAINVRFESITNSYGKSVSMDTFVTCTRDDGTTYDVRRIATTTLTSNTVTTYSINITRCGTDRITAYTIKPLTVEAVESGEIENSSASTSYTISGGYRWSEPDGYPIAGSLLSSAVIEGGTKVNAVFNSSTNMYGKALSVHYKAICVVPDKPSYKISKLVSITADTNTSKDYSVNISSCVDGHTSSYKINPVTNLGAVSNRESFTSGYTMSGTASWSESVDKYRKAGTINSAFITDGGTAISVSLTSGTGLYGKAMTTQYEATCEDASQNTRTHKRLASITLDQNTVKTYTMNVKPCGVDRVVAFNFQPVYSMGIVENPESFSSGYSLDGTAQWSEADDKYRTAGTVNSAFITDGGTNIAVSLTSGTGLYGKAMTTQYKATCEAPDNTTRGISRLASITLDTNTEKTYTMNVKPCGVDRVIAFEFQPVYDLGIVANPESFSSGYSLAGTANWSEAVNKYRTAGTLKSASFTDGGSSVNLQVTSPTNLYGKAISTQYELTCQLADGSTRKVRRIASVTLSSNLANTYSVNITSGCGTDKLISYNFQPVYDLGIVANPEGFSSGYSFSGTLNGTAT